MCLFRDDYDNDHPRAEAVWSPALLRHCSEPVTLELYGYHKKVVDIGATLAAFAVAFFDKHEEEPNEDETHAVRFYLLNLDA